MTRQTDCPTFYQIQVQGCVSGRWADWFDDMTIAVRDDGGSLPMTTLTGPVVDQAALLGMLQKLYTLGFPLLLVRRKEADDTKDTAEE
jgi:hypothetical protein